MKKETAIQMLGGTPSKAAEALGYKAVQAIYMWPDVLPQSIADRVAGAAQRLARKRGSKAQTPTEQITQGT